MNFLKKALCLLLSLVMLFQLLPVGSFARTAQTAAEPEPTVEALSEPAGFSETVAEIPMPQPTRADPIVDGDFRYLYNTWQYTMPNGEIQTYEGYSVCYVGAPVEELVVPGNYNGTPVRFMYDINEAIPSGTRSVLKTLTLPSSLVLLGGFKNCKRLVSVNFADLTELVYISNSCFANCYRLESDVVLQNFTEVGYQAFVNCFAIRKLQANGALLCSESFNYCYALDQFDGNYRIKIAENVYGNYFNFNYTHVYAEKPMYVSTDGSIKPDTPTLYVSGNWAFTGTPEDATCEQFMDPWTEDVSFPGELTHAETGEVFHIKAIGLNALYNLQPDTIEVTVGEGVERLEMVNSGGEAAGARNMVLHIRKLTLPHSLQSIREKQFYNNKVLTEVKFYENVTELPEQAFYNCTALQHLDLSEATGLTAVRERCFAACTSLEDVLLPEDSAITTIESGAFASCTSLQTVNLETLDKLTTLNGAFSFCDLRCVDLSNSKLLEEIPMRCFQRNERLTVIRLPEDGALTTIGKEAFWRDSSSPEHMQGERNPWAVTELNLPDTITSIGQDAFYNCFYQNVEEEPFVLKLPAGLTHLESGAFYTNYNRRYSDGALFLGNYVLASPELPAGLAEITYDLSTYGPFENSRIRELTLPAAMTVIQEGAFRSLYELERVTFRDGVTTIETDAFFNYNYDSYGDQVRGGAITELVGFDTLTTLQSVGGFGFNPLNAGTLTFPESVMKIQGFYDVGAEEIVIPESVESIGRQAFFMDNMMPFAPEHRRITFLNPGADKPVIGDELLHYEEADEDYFAWNDLDVPVYIRCYEGSAAHLWALDHNERNPNNQYTIELIGAEPGLFLTLLMPDGSPAPAAAYESVCWTDSSGAVVGTEAYVADFTPGETYTVTLVPSEDYDWIYRFEEDSATLTATATGGRVTLRLFPRSDLTVTFTVKSDTPDGQPINAALTLGTGNHSRTVTQTQTASGSCFTFDGLTMCDTDLVLETADRAGVTLTGVQLAADKDGVADLGEIEMTEPAARTRYEIVHLVADTSILFTNDDFTYTVRNTTQGTGIPEAEVAYGYLTIPADAAEKGDLLLIEAESTEDGNWPQLRSAMARFTVCSFADEDPVVELRHTEYENITYSFDNGDWSALRVGVYDENGALLGSFTPERTTQDGGVWYVKPGTYTMVALTENKQVGILPQLAQYETLGVADRILTLDVTVPSLGHGSVSGAVPAWDWIYLGDTEVFVSANVTSRDMVGEDGVKLVQFTYVLPESCEGLTKTFRVVMQSDAAEFVAAQGVTVTPVGTAFTWEATPGSFDNTGAVIETDANAATFSFLVRKVYDFDFDYEISIFANFSGITGDFPLGKTKMDFRNIQVTKLPSTLTKTNGDVVFTINSIWMHTASLYVDGVLVGEKQTNRYMQSVQIPWELPAVSGRHTFSATVKDMSGNVVYAQEPYTVEYLAMPTPQPLDLTINLHNPGGTEGVDVDKSISYDLLDTEKNFNKYLHFNVFLSNLNPNGTFTEDICYTFSLAFKDTEVVNPDSVVLRVYDDEGDVSFVPLRLNKVAGRFEGAYSLHADMATLSDRMTGFALDYEPIEDDSVPVETAVPLDLVNRSNAWHEQTAAAAEGFAPIGNDEIEAIFTELEDKYGIQIPEEIKADVRNFFYEMNDISMPLYVAALKLSEGMTATEEELAPILALMERNGSEPLPDEVTPEKLKEDGAIELELEDSGNTVYVLVGDGRIDLYDFTEQTHSWMLTGAAARNAEDDADLAELEDTLTTLEAWMSSGIKIAGAYDQYEHDIGVAKYRVNEVNLKLDKLRENWESVWETYQIFENDMDDDLLKSMTNHLKSVENQIAQAENELLKAQVDYENTLVKATAAEQDALSAAKRAEQSISNLASVNPSMAVRLGNVLVKARSLVQKLAHFLSNSTGCKLLGKALTVADVLLSMDSLFDSMDVYAKELAGIEQDRKHAEERLHQTWLDWANGKCTYEQYEKCRKSIEELQKALDAQQRSLNLLFSTEWVNAIVAVIGAATMMLDEVPPVLAANVLLSGAAGYWKVAAVGYDYFIIRPRVKECWQDSYMQCVRCRSSGSSIGSPGGGGGGGGGGGDGGGGGSNAVDEPSVGPVPMYGSPLIDPAGIVYEAVLSNVLEGASARIYYRADDGSEVLYDAENYNQVNPQPTDANGHYSWDTPTGLWKVRVSLDGYEDGNSEADPEAVDGWLPVLPPQLHVNIPMVSTQAPTVVSAAVSPDTVTVLFSQYMEIAQLDADASLVTVAQNGEAIAVTCAWADEEESPTESGVFYGRILKLRRTDGTVFSGDGITVRVLGSLQNYAGTPLAADYVSEALTVTQVLGSLSHSYPNRFVAESGEENELVVLVLDTEGCPMPGVTVTVRAEAGGTLELPESAVSDAYGRAVFPVQAVSAGYDVLHFSAGALARKDMNTRVLLPAAAGTDKPAASYADGSRVRDYDAVPPGTTVMLSTDTPDAVIYYTTDDSCPCTDSPNRYTYDGTPLVITEDVFLRIAAWTEEGGYSERLNLHLLAREDAPPIHVHTPGEPVHENEIAPTCTESGSYDAVIYCTGCGTELSREYTELPAAGHNFVNGVCTVCGAADPDYTVPDNPFDDVVEGEYYYDAVLWAFYHDPQITTGTNATHFSPNMACSRAQVVTFLWRAKGCPAPASTEIPFSDVPAGQWFTDAVLWAVENEITTGTGNGRFSPNMACSRSQVVTFLWRTEGKPAPSSSTIPFSDVPAGQWFTDAVLWAVEKGITGGTGGGRFSPNMTCSRGQIVTFLYRDLA